MSTINSPGANGQAHRIIRRHFEALNLNEPVGVTRANDLDTALHLTATSDAVAALRDGIRGGFTPAQASKALVAASTALVAQERAIQVHADVQRDLAAVARASLLDAAEQVITDLRPVLADAVEAINETVTMLGSLTPPKDAAAAPGLRDLLDRSTVAQAQVRAIVTVRQDLHAVGYGDPEDMSWWVTSAVDLNTSHARLLDLITSGIAVTVNTADESRTLAAARDAERQRLDAERADRKRQEAQTDPVARAWRRYRDDVRGGAPRDAA